MGSIGKHEASTSANNVIQFPALNQEKTVNTQAMKSMIDNERGWNYPEISENVDKLETSLNRARSATKIQAIARALKAQDTRITAEIERLRNGTADVIGSENALLSQRRRVRQLMRKAKI